MKKITLSVLLIVMFACFSTSMNAQANPTEEAIRNLVAFPEQMDSLERFVVFVDQQANESLFAVELVAGKAMEVDCNNHRLLGQFVEGVVDGWGYNYYIFETGGQVASTMMLCPGPKTERFVTGESITVRYNSRLPLVVYLPAGYELRYKIWAAGELQAAERK